MTVRPSIIIATVAIHASVIAGLLVFHRGNIHIELARPRLIDFDVVAPTPKPPPPIAHTAEPSPAPPARMRPQRRSARPASVAAPLPASTTTTSVETWVEAEPIGNAAPGPPGDPSGTGSGTGAGGIGSGTGGGDRDLSRSPVPLRALSSQTMPYTEQAARARISGDVQLVIIVDPLGHVASTTVRHGLGYGLDEIATRLAMDFLFKPATDRRGVPTTGSVRWRFHFEPP